MSNDAVAYAEERFKLVNSLIPRLKEKYSKPDESYAELRARYNFLNGQRASMISAVSRYIGGVYVDRSFVGQNSTSKPFTPVSMSYQKKAMDVLAKNVFAPSAFDVDKQVYPYLQMQRRGFDFFSSTEDFKLTGLMNNIASIALQHILHPTTLQRITNSRLYGNEYSAADVLNDLTKAIFDTDLSTNVNVYRQYVQGTYVKALSEIAGEKSMHDEVSKAAARYSLKKIKTKLATAVSTNEETKAHRSSLVYLVDKTLAVK
jgi:hypothetical protein